MILVILMILMILVILIYLMILTSLMMLVMINWQAPHSPLEAPQRFVDLYPDIQDPTRYRYQDIDVVCLGNDIENYIIVLRDPLGCVI